MNILNLLASGIVVALMMAGCSKAPGGDSRSVPLTDFSTNPVVRIDWPEMILAIPPSNTASIGSVSPSVRFDGTNIIIEAKYILRQRPATTTFNLNKLGMKRGDVSSSKVFWLNPDGTKKQLEIERTHAGQK